MNKALVITVFCALSLMMTAQVKKPVAAKNPKAEPTATVAAADTSRPKELEPPIPKEFAVYTKRYKITKPALRLCLNIVGGDSTLNYCMVDSLVRDPEKYKLLFQKKEADSTFALVYVSAFTKDPERPECVAGKETKLYFIRWNTKTNKAIVKQRYIESCYRTITRMSNENLMEYDGTSPLKLTYNRGSAFIDLTFDPANYKAGIQSTKE
jgi:hypothetical protein